MILLAFIAEQGSVALVDVRTTHPHLAGFLDYADLLRNESDRGAVLVSCGYLEQLLADILRAFMIEAKSAKDLIDGANAPLGTFSARIKATHALGLIRDREHKDLELMRHIRNQFAHNMFATFSDAAISDRCKQLYHAAHDYTDEAGGRIVMGPADQFRSCAVSLILNFTNRAHYVSHKRCTEGDWPY